MRLIYCFRALSVFCLSVLSSVAVAQNSPPCDKAVTNAGLTVGCPKVYDSYYLRQQLSSLQAQLQSIQAVSGASLPSSLGVIQGTNQHQLGVSFQLMAPATSATQTTTDSTGTSTQITGSALTPSVPTPPAGTLSPPTQGLGSLDRLAEAMQLQYQILNLQMLLDGSIDDKVSPDGTARRALTIGFPVTIEPPTSGQFKERQDHVAVIRVRLCQFSPPREAPSLITLLPSERTYNVAGISETGVSGGAGGVLGGVLNIGGGFLNSHKRYYIVQDQETLALQTAESGCSAATPGSSFVWEIKPVLGNRQIRSGMQTNFVQLAYDGDSVITANRGLLDVCVELSWASRSKSGAIDIPVGTSQCTRIVRPKAGPDIKELSVTNYAGSSLRLTAKGTFLAGTQVRIGNALVSNSNYQISEGNDTLQVSLSSSDLLAGDIALVGRDGQIIPFYAPIEDGATPLGLISMRRMIASDTTTHLFLQFELPKDKLGNYFTETSCDFHPARPVCQNDKNPWVVVIGDNVYGLQNAPFTVCVERDGTPGCGSGTVNAGYRTIDMTVPTSSLLGDPQITVRRLLWDPRYGMETRKVSLGYPVIDKTVSLSNSDGIRLLLMGSNLNNLTVLYPSSCDAKCIVASDDNPSLAQLVLTKSQVTGVKQVVFCKNITKPPTKPKCDSGAPVILDITKDLPETPTKASLKSATMTVGATTVALDGDKLETIVRLSYAGQPLTYHIAGGKLMVDLISTISNNVGVYPLRAKTADGTTLSATVTVNAKKP